MAQALFENEIKSRALSDFFVCESAGIFSDGCSPISSGAKNALSRLGINDFSHTSIKLTKEMTASFDFILCMTNSHRAYINTPNAYTLFSFIESCGDISDPYGQDDAVYYNTALEIQELIVQIADKLEKMLTNK